MVDYPYPDLVWLDEYPQGKVYTCIFFKPTQQGRLTFKELKESIDSRWYTESEFKKYFPDYVMDVQDYSISLGC